jgi:hypothetical protein
VGKIAQISTHIPLLPELFLNVTSLIKCEGRYDGAIFYHTAVAMRLLSYYPDIECLLLCHTDGAMRLLFNYQDIECLLLCHTDGAMRLSFNYQDILCPLLCHTAGASLLIALLNLSLPGALS